MKYNALGKVYAAGETIFNQGEKGNCMYVIQSGKVEVLHDEEGNTFRLSVLSSGDVFGEMALFERETRSATVKALEEARVLTIDKKTFLHRVHEDPSLAFRILENMSKRVREINRELAKSKAAAKR